MSKLNTEDMVKAGVNFGHKVSKLHPKMKPYISGVKNNVHVFDLEKTYKGKNILEVGNVLSHYFLVRHDIIDKYEKAKNVINKDITEYNPEKKYDLIISVSTLEHIGWEEKPKKPEKYEIAINHLKKMLVKGGKLIVTLPVGYNSFIDNKLKIRKLGFDKTYFMERYSKYNEWRQSGWKRAKEMKFNSPFRYANTIVIGIISG